MAVPYTFGTATAAIPLSNLDSNFATTITLGNTAIQLGNTVTTLNNMTLANVTVSSGSVTLTNIAVTTANVTTANIGTAVITGTSTLTGLTASTALALDASKNIVSVTNTGSGNNVLGTSPTIATPTINTITSAASTALVLQSNNGNTAVTVDTSQNVGIGTSSPNTNAKTTIKQASTGIYQLQLEQSNATDGYGLRCSASDGDLTFSRYASSAYSETMRITAAGNLGIGTSSPNNKLDVQSSANSTTSFIRGTGAVPNNNDNSVLYVSHGGTTGAAFRVRTDSAISASQFAHILVNNASAACTALQVDQYGTSPIADFTKSGTVAMRIDNSGNMFLGRTSQIVTGRFCVQNTAGSNTIETIQSGSGGYNYYSNAESNGGSYYHATFTEANTQRGSIVSNGSVTLYNTTSDQRLKENIVNAPEFGDVIDALQVRSFDWKSNQTHQRAGFIAQELVTVAPEAVHHPVNEEEMMAVDYSKLVPMLVKEIQSLRKRIVALESK